MGAHSSEGGRHGRKKKASFCPPIPPAVKAGNARTYGSQEPLGRGETDPSVEWMPGSYMPGKSPRSLNNIRLFHKHQLDSTLSIKVVLNISALKPSYTAVRISCVWAFSEVLVVSSLFSPSSLQGWKRGKERQSSPEKWAPSPHSQVFLRGGVSDCSAQSLRSKEWRISGLWLPSSQQTSRMYVITKLTFVYANNKSGTIAESKPCALQNTQYFFREKVFYLKHIVPQYPATQVWIW